MIYKVVFVVRYKTSKKSKEKIGIAVGNDVGDVDVIINDKGKVEKKIWDYKHVISESTVYLPIGR